MRRARVLSGEEAALWARVAATVVPIKGRRPQPRKAPAEDVPAAVPPVPPRPQPRVKAQKPAVTAPPPEPLIRQPVPRPLDSHGLDSSWDRKLAKGTLVPDFTLDLHGHSLDAAWMRLEHGLTQALAHGARVVLVITGRPRPADSADRGRQRGAIRAKLLDWLASGSHASRIAAVRGAHPRHGGAGAVYVVLRRGK